MKTTADTKLLVGFVPAGIGERRRDPTRHAVADGAPLCGAWADRARLVVREARLATVSCTKCLRKLRGREATR